MQSEAEVATLALDVDTPVAYVTQDHLVGGRHARHYRCLAGGALRISSAPDTRDICYATQNRQAAVRELSTQVDVLLVVGATNSSNSNRLCEIGAESGVPSYLVADGSELKPAWFANAQTVGITAGASAPEEMVKHVIDALRALGPVEVTTDVRPRRESRIQTPREVDETACRFHGNGGGWRHSRRLRSTRNLSIPLQQKVRVGAYIARQHFTRTKRYPLALMLEPLFRCNLACNGCGKIDYPDPILNQRISMKDCLEAVDECGAPVVSIAGGDRCCTRKCRRS